MSRYHCMVCVILLVCCHKSQSENILIAAEYGGGSHFISATRIGESLVRRGHNVTLFISNAFKFRIHDPRLSAHFNFELFQQGVSDEEMYGMFAAFGTLVNYDRVTQMFELLRITQSVNLLDCDAILSNNVTMQHLRDANYSAILFDIVWPCGRLIAPQIGHDVKTIGIFQTVVTSLLYQSAGIPLQPAFVPEFVSALPQRMNFLQRLENAILTFMTYSEILSIPCEVYKYDPLKLKHGIRPEVNMKHLLAETDLWLINVDSVMDFPSPSASNVIKVGGLTTSPSNPLETDLEDFVQSSGDKGVVIFTMGTYLTALKPELIKIFADAFAEINQNIVWHLPDSLKETLPFKLSKNVKTMPWIPQNDLLGHNKTRLMMYHGGNNGLHEALYHGVPLIVIPILGDQYDVATRVQERGMGLKIDKFTLSKEKVLETLNLVLSNKKYTDTAKRLSAIFRDRPQPPTERAAFWVEHVIKHGSDYMRSPVHDLSFIQLHLLDVIAFLILIGSILLYVAYRVVKLFILCLRRILFGKIKTD